MTHLSRRVFFTQQQFSHKRTESFDFCKSAVTSAPPSQHFDPLRAKTPATGIKSNCNVMPNPGMSPVLRKNIVMASQFRSNFNFRTVKFAGRKLNSISTFFFASCSSEPTAALSHQDQPVVLECRSRAVHNTNRLYSGQQTT